jgi:hypothetical protein
MKLYTQKQADEKILKDEGCQKIMCSICYYYKDVSHYNHCMLWNRDDMNFSRLRYTNLVYNKILNKYKLKRLKEILK